MFSPFQWLAHKGYDSIFIVGKNHMNELDALITNMNNQITSTRQLVTLSLPTCVSVEIYMYYWSHTVESIKDNVFNSCHIISYCPSRLYSFDENKFQVIVQIYFRNAICLFYVVAQPLHLSLRLGLASHHCSTCDSRITQISSATSKDEVCRTGPEALCAHHTMGDNFANEKSSPVS